jgi:hypothetical protein
LSHYTSVAVQFKNRKGLIDALVKSGVPLSAIEVHEKPQLLKDYCGHTTKYRYADTKDARFENGDCAHIIVRKKHTGAMNNDLGFYIEENGDSISFLCDYSRSSTKFNDKWLAEVRTHYSEAEIVAEHADKCEEVTKVETADKVYLYVKAGG